MKKLLLCTGVVLLLAGITTAGGKELGKIGSINPASKEIIVNTNSGVDLKMGDRLQVEIDSGKVELEVTFPMMTTSKCKIKGKSKISDLSKGMIVYRYSKDDELEETTLQTRKFGNIEMIKLPGGTFTMGSPDSEKDRVEYEKQHQVKVSSFWVGKYTVTQEEYTDLIGANPSQSKGDKLPVELVRWYDAVEFCNKLSEKNGLKSYYKIDKSKKDPNNSNGEDRLKYTVTILGGNGFRLPTEAEWEYACRGGTSTAFHYGDKLDSTMANFNGNYPYNAEKAVYRGKTTSVGSFKPNAYGLYDMHGNVWEWCWDWYGDYSSVKNDPKGMNGGDKRVIRGGAFFFDGKNVRSAFRYFENPFIRSYDISFRLVRSLK